MSVPVALPRMVFADMDDTFLARDKHVPQANMVLLDELARRGSCFVPCTGRPIDAVPAEVLAHPATRYAVGANGALVMDVTQGRPLCVRGLSKAAVIRLYRAVQGLEATFDVFTERGVLAERERYEAMSGYGIDEPTLKMLRRVRMPVDLSVPQIVERVDVVHKVTCFWHTERDREALLSAIKAEPAVACASGHKKDFELQASGVSKGSALVWLCEHAGVPTSDVTAFGDAPNDVSMLEVAGDGVAMANAQAAVRAVADHVAMDCDEAGVARYLVAGRT